MKNLLYTLFLIFVLLSCKDDDVNIFDKSSEQRASEAIASLKAELVAPANGWRLKYQPENGSGAYWVLLDFQENNEVIIKSDIPANDGEFYNATITYRIDNSLGLELIFESYSFFAYLFERDQASFGAEFEYIYANKTPDGELVFKSKTDFVDPTIVVFEPADASDDELFGRDVAMNLDRFPAAAKIFYTDKDLAVYLSLDVFKRAVKFNYVALKSDLAQGKAVDISTGYIIQGDSIIFQTPLDVTYKSNQVYIKSLYLNTLTEGEINVCPEPETVPLYIGKTSRNENITFETSLFNNEGASFRTRSEIYFGHLLNIRNENGERVFEQITTDIKYAGGMLFYNDSDDFNALGFYIENPDGTTAIVVREFTAVYTGNIVEFDFAPEISVFRTPHPDTNINNIDIYLDLMTEGGKTYIYRLDDQFYELYNPCSGWRFVFQAL
jgi:hypothetical protein